MEYVTQTILNGVACCHHTCGNLKLNENIVTGLMSLDLPDSEKQKYMNEVETALKIDLTASSTPTSGSKSGSKSGPGAVIVSNESENGSLSVNNNETISDGTGVGQDNSPVSPTPQQVSGYEMTSQNTEGLASSIRDFLTNPTISVSSIVAIAFVVLIIGAIFFGFRRKGI